MSVILRYDGPKDGLRHVALEVHVMRGDTVVVEEEAALELLTLPRHKFVRVNEQGEEVNESGEIGTETVDVVNAQGAPANEGSTQPDDALAPPEHEQEV